MDSLEALRAHARKEVMARHAREIVLGRQAADAASMGLRYIADITEYLNLVLDRLAEDGIGPKGAMAGTDAPTGAELNYPMEKLRAAASSARWLAHALQAEATRIELERNAPVTVTEKKERASATSRPEGAAREEDR